MALMNEIRVSGKKVANLYKRFSNALMPRYQFLELSALFKLFIDIVWVSTQGPPNPLLVK